MFDIRICLRMNTFKHFDKDVFPFPLNQIKGGCNHGYLFAVFRRHDFESSLNFIQNFFQIIQFILDVELVIADEETVFIDIIGIVQ